MYPGLLVPLLGTTALAALAIGMLVLRRPVARRLALRQLRRRPQEAMLAATGAVLGTAIITAALVVGDTLGFSVRQTAYQTLGPVDERVSTTNAVAAARVSRELTVLRRDPNVDGVLPVSYALGATEVRAATGVRAEPRTVVWSVDFSRAANFGSAGGSSGLAGPTPGPGRVVVNAPLANSLGVAAGNRVVVHVLGAALPLTVARVVPAQGLAGAGPDSASNRDAFVAPGVLARAAAATETPRMTWATLVSNRGGVQSGAALTAPVLAAIHRALGPTDRIAAVDTPKRDLLDAATTTADVLGALFLMIGSFSIIAGALLLVNIFVMLGEERKQQLGMLRAIGMRRAMLVGSLSFEGAMYAVGAIVPGLLLGVGVGAAVARLASHVFTASSGPGSALTIRFAVTPTSLVNAAALGLLIGLGAIVVTSARLSRLNVIAAIRDLTLEPRPRTRRLLFATATTGAVLLTAAAVPAVAASNAQASYLLPSLAAAAGVPLLSRLFPRRAAVTVVAAAVLGWCLLLPVLRPRIFDHASMTVFVIEGTLLALAGVVLISVNQQVLLRPIRAVPHRRPDNALAVRLAVAYPLAKRFRTGATLVMYTIVTLVLVLLVEISGVLDTSIGTKVAQATASYDLRVDLNPANGAAGVAALRGRALHTDIAAVTPLVAAPAAASDPGQRTAQQLHALAVGVSPAAVSGMRFLSRLPSAPTDAAVWRLIARDPRYVAVDQFFGSTGGPPARYYVPGDTFRVLDQRTGTRQTKIIAGVLTNATVFYPYAATGSTYPFVESATAVRSQFGVGATVDAALLAVRPGVPVGPLAARLQGRFLAAGLVATPVGPAVRRLFAANIAFFQLMEGFLALGLLIGVAGIGVVMVRAVRERRRTIGVLRALGVQARTVRRAFLLESAVITAEGLVLGSVLGVVTTWLLYRRSSMFDGIRSGFPIEWPTILALVALTFLASLAATAAPSRRAAGIRPALAVRVAD